jgi:hypothetical protein
MASSSGEEQRKIAALKARKTTSEPDPRGFDICGEGQVPETFLLKCHTWQTNGFLNLPPKSSIFRRRGMNVASSVADAPMVWW